jgi:uncharacterized membrane protein (UPF0127 family)
MKKRYLLIMALIFLSGCSSGPKVEIQTDNGKISFDIEIADESEEILKGLMYREKLDEDKGMLFVYPDSQIRSFWMKNTKIALDIIFIDENYKIINIEEAEPCVTKTCRRYKSIKPAKYVLEINKGLSKKYGIKEKDKISLQK